VRTLVVSVYNILLRKSGSSLRLGLFFNGDLIRGCDMDNDLEKPLPMRNTLNKVKSHHSLRQPYGEQYLQAL
jgi:hypothetical protein